MPLTPTKPQLEHFIRVNLRVKQRFALGENPNGKRLFVPLSGGDFSGKSESGEVVDGGGDWLLIRDDGTAVLDARYTLKTADDQYIYIQDQGLRVADAAVMQEMESGKDVDPARYYFRTHAKMETAIPRLSWLNQSVFVGSGMKSSTGVTVDFYRVL